MAEKRHYCYYCKRKRIESEMSILSTHNWGRARWVCNTCGDSRNDSGYLYFIKRKNSSDAPALNRDNNYAHPHSPLEDLKKKCQ